jgi:hypothetical protein
MPTKCEEHLFLTLLGVSDILQNTDARTGLQRTDDSHRRQRIDLVSQQAHLCSGAAACQHVPAKNASCLTQQGDAGLPEVPYCGGRVHLPEARQV